MQSAETAHDTLSKNYTIAFEALCDIAKRAFFLGQIARARQVLQTILPLLEASEVEQRDRIKVLLQLARIMIIDHFLARTDSGQVFPLLHQARQIAEAEENLADKANVLAILSDAHYFSAVQKSRTGDTTPHQSPGTYAEALTYQEQALAIRETNQDSKGISESLFLIGTVYERWQQYDKAHEYNSKALETALQAGHILEQAEPNRHLAVQALRQHNLDQAGAYALQALSYREEGGFVPYLPLDHLLLRDIYEAQGKTIQAQFHREQASRIAEEMGYPSLTTSMPNIVVMMASLK